MAKPPKIPPNKTGPTDSSLSSAFDAVIGGEGVIVGGTLTGAVGRKKYNNVKNKSK